MAKVLTLNTTLQLKLRMLRMEEAVMGGYKKIPVNKGKVFMKI